MSLGIDLTRVMRKEEVTDTCMEKLRFGGAPLMEMLQWHLETAHLFFTSKLRRWVIAYS